MSNAKATSNVTNLVTSPNDTRRADLKKALVKLGGESVTVSKPEMALRIVQASIDGIIGEKDAEPTFREYLAGRVKKIDDTNAGMLDDEGAQNENSLKANISTNKQLIKAGAMIRLDAKINFKDVLDRAVKLRAADVKAGVDVKPPYDCFVDLAREQLKNEELALSDEQITDKIRKPGQAEEKSFLDKLIDDHSRLVKRRDDSADETEDKQPLPELVAIVDSLTELVERLGGTVKKTKAEEKEAAVIAMAIKTGKVKAA